MYFLNIIFALIEDLIYPPLPLLYILFVIKV